MKSALFAAASAALLLSACSSAGSAASGSASAGAPAPIAPAAATEPAAAPTMRPAPVTPAEVRAMIARDGAQRTVAALNRPATADGPARWGSVEAGLASGEQAWLDLYPALRPGVDGETGEGASAALSQALTSSNAAGVLRLMRESDEVSGICQFSGVEPTSQQRRDFDTRATASVQAINEPALARFRAACLEALRADQATPG